MSTRLSSVRLCSAVQTAQAGAPTPETEQLFLESLDRTRNQFDVSLSASRQEALRLPDLNLDTGAGTALGKYTLADTTYEKLLEKLADH